EAARLQLLQPNICWGYEWQRHDWLICYRRPGSKRPPTYSVEYVEFYNHRAARRRRLCRIFAWLLAVFLLLDIGVVLYIGLRMRQHQRNGSDSADSTVNCRIRFRQADGRVESRSELVKTDGSGRVLMQPSWDSDGRPTVLHNQLRGFTLLRAPSAQLCFVKRSTWRRHDWASNVVIWAKEQHEVSAKTIQYVRLAVRYPPISERDLMSYGSEAWHMCRGYQTYLVQPIIFRYTFKSKSVDAGKEDSSSTDEEQKECPMLDCVNPCPGNQYLHDENGCRTCNCGTASNDAEPGNRDKRAVPEVPQPRQQKPRRRQLQIDEGVLPGEDGRSVHIVDVIDGIDIVQHLTDQDQLLRYDQNLREFLSSSEEAWSSLAKRRSRGARPNSRIGRLLVDSEAAERTRGTALRLLRQFCLVYEWQLGALRAPEDVRRVARYICRLLLYAFLHCRGDIAEVDLQSLVFTPDYHGSGVLSCCPCRRKVRARVAGRTVDWDMREMFRAPALLYLHRDEASGKSQVKRIRRKRSRTTGRCVCEIFLMCKRQLFMSVYLYVCLF
uniref:BRICHOS domain-containing protein n=1 Tax=Macrostomum lignano TaxID=282301 RepID=A0A1I8HC01_9PLAT